MIVCVQESESGLIDAETYRDVFQQLATSYRGKLGISNQRWVGNMLISVVVDKDNTIVAHTVEDVS